MECPRVVQLLLDCRRLALVPDYPPRLVAVKELVPVPDVGLAEREVEVVLEGR